MKRFFRLPKSIGRAPGTLVTADQADLYPLRITVMEYGDGQAVKEREVGSVPSSIPFNSQVQTTWMNIDGSHRVEVLQEIGDLLEIHPLALEDILDTSQRPKLEDYQSYLFLELNMLLWADEKNKVEAEQISLVLGKDYVITFQENEKDVFDPVRKRLRENKSRISTRGADYLAYSLIDAVVDHYFLILEHLGEKVEILEEELIANPTPDTLQSIHDLKQELIFLRKSVWPLREVIGSLERGESPLILKDTLWYLRDVYDHTIQIMDAVETFRDMVSGMLDIYLSSVSNRMNEVMKVLTIIATIFMPLSFIVGLYGMNFRYMPELEWQWGYGMVWGVIVLVVVSMVVYFRWKDWL